MGSGLFQLRGGLYNSPIENLQVGAPIRSTGAETVAVGEAPGTVISFFMPLPSITIDGPGDALLIEAIVLQATTPDDDLGLTGIGAGLAFAANGVAFSLPLAQSTATALNAPSGNHQGVVLVLQTFSPLLLAEDMRQWAFGPPGFTALPGYPFSDLTIQIGAVAVASTPAGGLLTVIGQTKARKISGTNES